MKVSLLYLNERVSRAEPISERILYHLSLDRSFSYICADVGKRKDFLSVISDLTDDKEEILYRQDIVKELEDKPELLEQLVSLSERFNELMSAQKNTGKEGLRLNARGSASAESAKNILCAEALSLKRALLFIKAYGDILAKYNLHSKGLRRLYSSCKEICDEPDYQRLITYCSKYEYFSANGIWDFKLHLNGEGRIDEYSLIDHRYVRITEQEPKKKRLSFFGKALDRIFPCSDLKPSSDGLYERLSVFALSELSRSFENLSEQIFERFGSLRKELVFYEVALKYLRALFEKMAPVSYPSFSEDKRVNVKGLYDLYLLMSRSDPADIVPNDYLLGQDVGGLLVFGDNGSGKTVYLRSIGTMHLMAQAGLPIPCESAQITLFSQFAAQFSEAEKEFCEGNDAGRFEQEVRELAEMVDCLKEGSLVFLNETFQSTAYAEGAEGIYHLLKYFSDRNIRWILVSHLRQLEEMLDLKDAALLRASNGYKIN